jgi:hypothetical protein
MLEVYPAEEAHVCTVPLYVPTGIEVLVIVHTVAIFIYDACRILHPVESVAFEMREYLRNVFQ